MKTRARSGIWTSLVFLLAIHTAAQTQAPATEPAPPPQAEPANAPPAPQYTPKFKGDPAHSEAEASALGYIRTFLTAEKLFYKKHSRYTKSLQELAASPGSFTRRMTNTDRGDYVVEFHSQGKAGSRFSLTLTPKTFDAQHRAFFADDTGVIRVDETKAATEDSPKL